MWPHLISTRRETQTLFLGEGNIIWYRIMWPWLFSRRRDSNLILLGGLKKLISTCNFFCKNGANIFLRMDQSKVTGYLGRVFGKICLKRNTSPPFFTQKSLRPIKKTLNPPFHIGYFCKKKSCIIKFCSEKKSTPAIFFRKVCRWSCPCYPLHFDPSLGTGQNLPGT